MKKYQFKVKQHEEYGMLGFAPSWYPNGDPLPGMTVAHDILEHFPKDNGQAEGELLALGAALWIRGDSGYMQRHGNVNAPEVHIAADLPMIWDFNTNRDGRSTVDACGLSRDSELMERCRGIVSTAIREMHDEDRSTPDTDTQEMIARWIAKGYVKAQKRYKRYGDSYSIAYSLFKEIEERADNCLKHAEEGMVLTVSVNLKDLTTTMDCDYPYEEEF